jgi:hypothetical protein
MKPLPTTGYNPGSGRPVDHIILPLLMRGSQSAGWASTDVLATSAVAAKSSVAVAIPAVQTQRATQFGGSASARGSDWA